MAVIQAIDSKIRVREWLGNGGGEPKALRRQGLWGLGTE